jgi:glutathione S-transferase
VEAICKAAAAEVQDASKRAAATKCLAYVRDRVGVPRDMSYPAAMHFRASLNTAIAHLK